MVSAHGLSQRRACRLAGLNLSTWQYKPLKRMMTDLRERIIGLAVYSGDRFPAWRGDLFSGGLKSQQIRHIKLDGDGRVLEERSIRIGARVRDVRQGPDGFLYLLTDQGNGRLLRLEPAG